MDNTNKADIRVYVGATGSGKGASVRDHLKATKPRRLLVWDPMREYSQFCRTVTDDLEAVAKKLAAAGPTGDFTITFHPGDELAGYEWRFKLFCKMAMSAGNCTVLVEELADVTTASHAPPLWARIIRAGRHRGLRVIGCTQRPASVDKGTLSNNTFVRVFQMNWLPDLKVTAQLVRVPLAQVEALVTTEDEKKTVINYIERARNTGKTTAGQMILRRK